MKDNEARRAYSYYEVLNEIVQQEPATSLNGEQMGSVAAIGLVRGNPFPPDAGTE